MDDELTELGSTECRHLRDLAKAWASYGPALREWSALDGGMQWKAVNGAEYLTRYRQDPETGKKRFTSLGRRSPETERAHADFLKRRDEAKQTVLAGRDGIAKAGRVAKAYGLARMPAKSAELIRAFWRRSMDEHMILFGGTALYAYEIETQVLAPSVLTRDENLIFLLKSGRSDVEHIAAVYKDFVGDDVRVREDSGRITMRHRDFMGVDLMPREFLLERCEVADQAEVIAEAFAMPSIAGLTVARDAFPVEISAPNPRAYALMCNVLAADDDIWADRAAFAGALVRERCTEQFDPRQAAAFPDICLDADEQPRFRSP